MRRSLVLFRLLVATALPGSFRVAFAQQAPERAGVEAAPIVMPQLLAPLQPEYPSNGTTDARVIVHVTLDATGTVTAVEVVSGDEPFASAAQRAVRNGRFSPAHRGGVAVAAKIKIAVDFTYSAPETPDPVQPKPEARPENPSAAVPSPSEPALPPPQQVVDIIVRAPRVDESERPIHKAEARLMAGTFGDPLRAVELLPGITPLISGVPYFFVRGAPSGSVNFYVDEARIPQLYHVGPGSSVMHPLFVEGVALRSGPYRARYGNATSGVVSTRVVTDVPDFGVEAEAKVFESSAYVGVPLAGGRGALAAAAKLSHLRPVLELVAPEVRLEYSDYQAMASYSITPRDQVTALLFGATDFVGEVEGGEVDINLDTEFHRLKLGYNRNLDAGVDLHNYVILGVEQSRFHTEDELLSDRSLGAGTQLSVAVDEVWEWAVGASGEAVDYDASGASAFFGNSSNVAVSRVDSEVAAFGEGRVSPGAGVHLDGGVRLAGYTSSGQRAGAVEPRLSSTLDLTPRWTSILAVGYATQAPTTAVPAPAVRPAELLGGLQEALQRAATLRYRLPHHLTAEATAFYLQRLLQPVGPAVVVHHRRSPRGR